jgi:NAD(P)-dependent dehydrogenase (short-subunit alcohol dehydrogenase family)
VQNLLVGKRALITQSTEFMGPALCKVFAEQGATVLASQEALSEPEAAESVVPLGRLVTAREDAQFAAYLCSSAADCFVGQVFPVCGGWVPR